MHVWCRCAHCLHKVCIVFGFGVHTSFLKCLQKFAFRLHYLQLVQASETACKEHLGMVGGGAHDPQVDVNRTFPKTINICKLFFACLGFELATTSTHAGILDHFIDFS
jgi:hypothetical protein